MKTGLLSFLLLLAMSGAARALESDSEKPVYIEANSAFYDEKTDQSTYTGKVVLIQGSLRVESDKLIAYSPGGEVKKVVAMGNPVRFWQKPEPDEEIHGTAKKAEYYLDREVIVLIGNAVVWQNGNKYASDRIEYDQIKGTIKAGEPTSDTKRVKIILKPKKDGKRNP